MLNVAFGESIMSRTQVLLFGLRKAEKMSIRMLVLIARAHQQPIKTLKMRKSKIGKSRNLKITVIF